MIPASDPEVIRHAGDMSPVHFGHLTNPLPRRIIRVSLGQEGSRCWKGRIMQVVSTDISNSIQGASWIRRMFEAGIELKQKFGADQVCDFTLGNPDLPPVPEIARTLRTLADTVGQPLSLGYMPNAGLPSVRQRLAEDLARAHPRRPEPQERLGRRGCRPYRV